MQPITVTRPDKAGNAVIRHGERRWRAAKIAGLEKIRVLIDEKSDEEARSLDQYVENEQREGLSPSEIVAFVAERLATGMKAVELAAQIGKSQAAISKFAAIGGAPRAVVEQLDRVGIETAYILLQCHKLDPGETERLIDLKAGDVRYREAVDLQTTLKGGEPTPLVSSDAGGAEREADVEAGTISDQEPEAPNKPIPSPSAAIQQGHHRPSERDLDDRLGIVVNGARARFISGTVLFEGESEPRFIELTA